MQTVIAVARTLDPKTLSEAALALCVGGAVVVWLGIRVDRYLFRWAGMTVIVAGLLGLIFQNSLSRQTLAASGGTAFPTIQASSPSPTISPTPSRTPSKGPSKKKHGKKPAPKPAPPSYGGGGSGGGYVPPPSKPPSQPPLPPIQGSPVPP